MQPDWAVCVDFRCGTGECQDSIVVDEDDGDEGVGEEGDANESGEIRGRKGRRCE